MIARHPNYFDADAMDRDRSALIRLTPTLLSVIDHSGGLGHEEMLTVGAGRSVEMTAERPNNSGLNPAPLAA